MPPKRKTHCLRGHLRDRVDPNGTCYYCKEIYQLRYRATPKGNATYKSSMLKKYGITFLDYCMMANAQDHKCLICGKQKPLVVDHDHVNNRIRGLLCLHCNSVILNVVENNLALVKQAQQYLEVGYGNDWNSAKV